jgi:hypothetical protein
MFEFLFGSGSTPASEGREIFSPSGSGTGEGRAFYFCFGLPEANAQELAQERLSIQHNVQALTDHGYRVIVEPAATRQAFEAALYNEDPDLEGARTMGLLWSSHGDKFGRIQTAGDEWISLDEIDGSRVSPLLTCLVFSACHVGSFEENWKQALGGARIYGWGKPVSFERARDFYIPNGTLRTRLDGILERELSLPDGVILQTYLCTQEKEEEWVTLDLEGDAELSVWDFTDLENAFDAAVNLLLLPHDDATVSEEVLSLRVHFEDGRRQSVNVFLSEGTVQTRAMGEEQLVFVESYVGPWSSIVDDAELLHHNTKLHLGHVQIFHGEQEMLFVKGATGVRSATPQILAYMMEEISMHGDLLEEALFGVDED